MFRKIIGAVLLAASPFLPMAIATAARSADPKVEFGSEHSGSPFAPQLGHDRSTHAADKLVPRTVTIPVGGSVTYEVYAFHRAAVYRPGITVEDIDTGPASLNDVTVPCVPQTLPDFDIDDPEGRLAWSPPQSCAKVEWTTPPGTFDQPGRYLVVCTTVPHFRSGMTGWVIVQ